MADMSRDVLSPLLMAQMRSADRVRKCLLLGVDRTYRGHHENDAFDPTTDLVSLQGAPCLPPVPDNRCLNDSSQPALLLEPIGDQRAETNISDNMLTAS